MQAPEERQATAEAANPAFYADARRRMAQTRQRLYADDI